MIEIALVLWATIFDALRDRFYPRLQNSDWWRWTREQWRWHIFKWLAFYPPLVYVIWTFHFYEKLFLALVCFLVWRAAYLLKRRRRLYLFLRDTDAMVPDESKEFK